MADGSTEDRIGLKQMDDLTFSAATSTIGDTKRCYEQSADGNKVKLSFYTELDTRNPCEKSDASSVVECSTASLYKDFPKPSDFGTESAEERKKRCFDRYDSSESSDSGVVVLSPTESSACSGSDLTEPSSPRSPESACSGAEDSADARMPPWASEAPPAARRLAAQPVPTRRSQAQLYRRITEYFNQKMKPHHPIKRECTALPNDDTKRKCLPKNGVTHDLEKYISYLSQTLSPKLLDVGKQPDSTVQNVTYPKFNEAVDSTNTIEPSKSLLNSNGILDPEKSEDIKDKAHSTMNGFVEFRQGNESRISNKVLNGVKGVKKLDSKLVSDLSANGVVKNKRQEKLKRKLPAASSDMIGLRIAPSSSVQGMKNNLCQSTPDSTNVNGVVSSTTKLDSRMNGVTCGSNNISLNPISSKHLQIKKEPIKKTMQPMKRNNRKTSACVANTKNMTWSKANNLKQQVQLQKQQNYVNATQSVGTSTVNMPGEASTAPKINIPNGVRQMSMTLNGNLSNLNVPVTNLQNCHQLNIPSPYNGTVTSTNLASFVAVPQNVMLTTLRIPQNGISAQTINQPNNLGAFKSNVSMNSPTKLNGQFVFPLMQNINGAVVQIPNLMAKMPNFVLPQPQLAQRQDHLQNQQATQFLINGTLLKLANTMPSPYPNSNVNLHPNKPNTINKNGPGVPPLGVTVQTKPNYTVNLSHSMLMSQPGFIVTSVPNVNNVKETWSYNMNTNSAATSCSNPIVHHPPVVASFTAQPMHSSSIPIAPVKPPDNPIQGTDPPSSTVKEPELADTKCDIPWLMKTVNNNIVPLDLNKKTTTRPFAQISSFTNKAEPLITENLTKELVPENKVEKRTGGDKTEQDANKMSMLSTEETVFTEIVVKDVSSNVSNTVIEANFCCTTTESSESGIGTDKSIDSPSDSQTSKECDEDSSLSLSVSVCSVELPKSQKSPILKQPKTLRFPPRTKTDNKRTSSTDTTSNVTMCLWENCGKDFDTDTELLSHLQTIHVESQAGKENYVCLWERCKVRGKPSCSSLWLERHASSHGGNKPFKCIVDGCEKRFSTQILLERHVNHHFTETSPSAGSGKKTTDSATKLIRRNGKKLRYRREPWSARMFDYFDAGIMEGVSWRVLRAALWRGGGACPLRDAGSHALTLHAALAATRRRGDTTEALLTYYPPDVIEDEWVPLESVQRVKQVEIASLPARSKVLLYDMFCESYAAPSAAAAPAPAAPAPLMPPPRATSSRLLSSLLSKKREVNGCCATNRPPPPPAPAPASAPSGAAKRKMGRKYGGNSFWPCGR